jgi:hypothetical protein
MPEPHAGLELDDYRGAVGVAPPRRFGDHHDRDARPTPRPADPSDIMAALLRTPPPPVGDKNMRRVSKRKPKKGGK